MNKESEIDHLKFRFWQIFRFSLSEWFFSVETVYQLKMVFLILRLFLRAPLIWTVVSHVTCSCNGAHLLITVSSSLLWRHQERLPEASLTTPRWRPSNSRWLQRNSVFQFRETRKSIFTAWTALSSYLNNFVLFFTQVKKRVKLEGEELEKFAEEERERIKKEKLQEKLKNERWFSNPPFSLLSSPENPAPSYWFLEKNIPWNPYSRPPLNYLWAYSALFHAQHMR